MRGRKLLQRIGGLEGRAEEALNSHTRYGRHYLASASRLMRLWSCKVSLVLIALHVQSYVGDSSCAWPPHAKDYGGFLRVEAAVMATSGHLPYGLYGLGKLARSHARASGLCCWLRGRQQFWVGSRMPSIGPV